MTSDTPTLRDHLCWPASFPHPRGVGARTLCSSKCSLAALLQLGGNKPLWRHTSFSLPHRGNSHPISSHDEGLLFLPVGNREPPVPRQQLWLILSLDSSLSPGKCAASLGTSTCNPAKLSTTGAGSIESPGGSAEVTVKWGPSCFYSWFQDVCQLIGDSTTSDL